MLASIMCCSCAERMAVAAEVYGCQEEAAFWRALPSTLATLRSSLPASFTQPAASLVLYTDPQTGISAYRRSSDDRARWEQWPDLSVAHLLDTIEAAARSQDQMCVRHCWLAGTLQTFLTVNTRPGPHLFLILVPPARQLKMLHEESFGARACSLKKPRSALHGTRGCLAATLSNLKRCRSGWFEMQYMRHR